MAIVVPNCGELLLLEWALKSTSTPEALTLKLYKSDTTPSATSVAGDFSVADFTGYEDKSIARASWSAPSTDGNGKAATAYAEQSWSVGSTQTVYGAYVVGATSGTLVFAERFASARSVQSGDTLKVTPNFTLASE